MKTKDVVAGLGEIGRPIQKLFSKGDFVVNCKDGLLLITDYEGKVNVGDILTT